ncbi:MAG: DNA gyrase inhibitor YacG [Gammaproteobacteria bacterium]|nr:DNA gyrase inhibitor YacG [Gammaproteobacteria bacterium]
MTKSYLNDRVVTCPTCQKSTSWDSKNESRPFCSERCKLIDFGEWAKESYVISESDSSEPSKIDQ